MNLITIGGAVLINLTLCAHCGGEIYDDDIICDLNEIYGNGCYIVHEECIADSLCENKHSVTQYLFDDLCVLIDMFDKFIIKYIAQEYFEFLEDDVDDVE